MPTYVVLCRLTQEGVTKIKEGPERIKGANELIERLGGKIKEGYALFGPYDYLFIVEAPDDEAGAKMAVGVAMRGAVRCETYKAIPIADFTRLVGEL